MCAFEAGSRKSRAVVEVSHPNRDAGLGRSRARDRQLIAAVGEVLLADVEPGGELAEQLQRRDSLPVLDPRDVRGGAAREGKCPLADACLLACGAQAATDADGVVDVTQLLPGRHLSNPIRESAQK